MSTIHNNSDTTLIPFSAQITKKQVDNFRSGRRIPHCEIKVEWMDEDRRPVKLYHDVELKGAKEPFNYITIESDPLPRGSYL